MTIIGFDILMDIGVYFDCQAEGLDPRPKHQGLSNQSVDKGQLPLVSCMMAAIPPTTAFSKRIESGRRPFKTRTV